MRITVLSTFDVWPAIDGGQTRYVSIWTKFSAEHEITILAYDFRNTAGERRYRLAPHVEVVVARAEEADAKHFLDVMGQTGLWLHDVLAIDEYRMSADYIGLLRAQLARCDVLVASHPYLANVAFGLAPARALKVYEAHNVELDIKRGYFRTGTGSRRLLSQRLRQVEQVERLAVQMADHVTAVSEADRKRLEQLYDVLPMKTSVVQNGVHARAVPSLGEAEREELRAAMGLAGRQVAVIVASSYAPNIEAYRITRLMLHEAGFGGVILLLGAIGNALLPDWPDVGFEERVFGFVSDELKTSLLECADFAPHFVFDGAGTNLKLLDYIGHGVPVIANLFGVRGTTGDDWYWPAENVAALGQALADIPRRPDLARLRAQRGREMALAHFDWAALAARFEHGMRLGFPPAEIERSLALQSEG